MVNTVIYTYTLECGHTATAVTTENDSSAYLQGQSIVCPKDHYAKKKITSVAKAVGSP